ncbi:MAG: hypothetical protein JO104_01765 [Candidatus Eremiobacteraeota bacterium]|nr:hypothetical protein [Candidatus Eremiobacteraeota bacterium]
MIWTKRSSERYYARGIDAVALSAALLFCACSGPQAPYAVSPAGAAVGTHGSPAAAGAILYATANTGKVIYAFSYPLGARIGQIAPPKTVALEGICNDPYGDIYVTALSGAARSNQLLGHVYEYQHGGTRPVQHWEFTGLEPFGCSYDAATANLAVATASLGIQAGALFVVNTNTQRENVYYSYTIGNFYYCGYDAKSNLFVNGQGAGTQMYFAELRKGATALTDVALGHTISVSGMGQVQWDGHYVTVEDLTASAILRLHISGSRATVAGTTHLSSWNGPTLSWIDGSSVVIPTGTGGATLGEWRYPRGGKPSKTVKAPTGLFSVTVSAGSVR